MIMQTTRLGDGSAASVMQDLGASLTIPNDYAARQTISPTLVPYKELLAGCGSSRQKKLWTNGQTEWLNVTTLDRYPECHPDVLWDLTKFPWPFPDNWFDQAHFYEVIEHCSGQQGDEESFFAFFSEIHRILKPDGILLATVPAGIWAWADPGHRRVITYETLCFLSQEQYAKQVGRTPMTDYRHIYKADFEWVWKKEAEFQIQFALRAIKG